MKFINILNYGPLHIIMSKENKTYKMKMKKKRKVKLFHLQLNKLIHLINITFVSFVYQKMNFLFLNANSVTKHKNLLIFFCCLNPNKMD